MAINFISTQNFPQLSGADDDTWMLLEPNVLTSIDKSFDFQDYDRNSLLVQGTIGSTNIGIFSNNFSADNTIQIAQTGVIFGDNAGLDLKGTSGHQVFNDGLISSSKGTGIVSDTDSSTFVSTGTINAKQAGIVAFADAVHIENSGSVTSTASNGLTAVGDGGMVTNSGTVNSNNAALLTQGAQNTQFNSGTILSASEGIAFFGPGGSIDNSGNITVSTIGVDVFYSQDVTFVNSGMITAGDLGAQFFGGTTGILSGNGSNFSVSNLGTLSGANVGLRLMGDDANVFNSGTISGGSIGIEFVDTALGTDSHRVVNTGTIASNGTTGQRTAIDGSNDTDLVINHGKILAP